MDSSGNVTRWFIRGVGIAEGTGDVLAEIVGSDSSAKVIYYLCNHRGDTMLAYRDDNGTETLVARYRYDAFGNVTERQTSSIEPRYTFSTKEYLSDAELYLYAYRVYDPVAGRWTQRDPIDYQDSVNLYQFCGNNPVNGVDPNGQLYLQLKIGAMGSLFYKLGISGGISLTYHRSEGFTAAIIGSTEHAVAGFNKDKGMYNEDASIGVIASASVSLSVGAGSYKDQLGEGHSTQLNGAFLEKAGLSVDGPGNAEDVSFGRNPVEVMLDCSKGGGASYGVGFGGEVTFEETHTYNGVSWNNRKRQIDWGSLNEKSDK